METLTRSRWMWGSVLMALILAGTLVALDVGGSDEDGSPTTSAAILGQDGASPPPGQSRSRFPVVPPGGGGEAVSIEEAREAARFDVLVPSTDAANEENSTGAYVSPLAVEMTFPPPSETSADLRQPDIRVWESPWPKGDEPMVAFERDIKATPDEGKGLCKVGTLPALCVEPRSPSDVDRANAAFVRTVIGDVDVELSGGDSVQILTEVAESLQRDAQAGSE